MSRTGILAIVVPSLCVALHSEASPRARPRRHRFTRRTSGLATPPTWASTRVGPGGAAAAPAVPAVSGPRRSRRWSRHRGEGGGQRGGDDRRRPHHRRSGHATRYPAAESGRGFVRRFIAAFGDHYDQIAVFLTFNDLAMPQSLAYQMPIKNDVSGIGLGLFDSSAEFGSPSGRLQTALNMKRILAYGRDAANDPANDLYSVWAQEAAHRWSAYLRFKREGDTDASDALLGRQKAHWAQGVQADASIMDGYLWTDNGDGTFSPTDETSATALSISSDGPAQRERGAAVLPAARDPPRARRHLRRGRHRPARRRLQGEKGRAHHQGHHPRARSAQSRR